MSFGKKADVSFFELCGLDGNKVAQKRKLQKNLNLALEDTVSLTLNEPISVEVSANVTRNSESCFLCNYSPDTFMVIYESNYPERRIVRCIKRNPHRELYRVCQTAPPIINHHTFPAKIISLAHNNSLPAYLI